MLNQHRRRWVDVVQMLYRCFEFAVIAVDIAVILVTKYKQDSGREKT